MSIESVDGSGNEGSGFLFELIEEKVEEWNTHSIKVLSTKSTSKTTLIASSHFLEKESSDSSDTAAISLVTALAGSLCMIVPIPGFRIVGSILLGTAAATGAEALRQKSTENRRA